jgi:hypothetical protein
MTNKDEIKTACIVLILVISIILIISLLYKKNNKSTEYEQFLNYQDAKKKTLNWCSKMQSVGLLSNEQLDQCVARYREPESPVLPAQVSESTDSNLEVDYSLYNSRQKNITSNNILDTNTSNIMLINSDGLYMGCSSNNSVYFTNDNKQNYTELIFSLTPLNNNIYALSSKNNKYLMNNEIKDEPVADIPIIIAGGGGGGGGASGGVAGGLGGSGGSNTNGDGSSGVGNATPQTTSIIPNVGSVGGAGGLGGPFKKSTSENSTSGISLAGSTATNTGGGGGGSNGGMMGNSNGSGGGAGGSYVNPNYIITNTPTTFTTNISTVIPSVVIDWTLQPNPPLNPTTTQDPLNPKTTKPPPRTIARFTGAQQTWTVPSFIYPGQIPITQATFTVIGGKGSGYGGGYGARIVTTLKVTPGETYNIFIGTYASGSNGGKNQSGYNGGNGVGSGGGGGAATTIFLGVTPEKTKKASKQIFCASFIGKTLGSMTSWAITKYDSDNNNYKNLTFESVKKSNYFLSSTVNNADNTLVLNNGNDVTNMWKAIPIKNNTPQSATLSTLESNYLVSKSAIITKLINVKAKIMCLEAFRTTLYNLKNIINSNYQGIENYVNDSITVKNNTPPIDNPDISQSISIPYIPPVLYNAGDTAIWIVPEGVTSAYFTVVGGKGGKSAKGESNTNNFVGGKGAQVTTTLINLKPGKTFYIYVGNNGSRGYGAESSDMNNTFGGGNPGEENPLNNFNPFGSNNLEVDRNNSVGGGGSASFISTTEDPILTPIIIAGGGGGSTMLAVGGSGAINSNGDGGNGGDSNGTSFFRVSDGGLGGIGTTSLCNLTKGESGKYDNTGGGGGGCNPGKAGQQKDCGGGAGGSYVNPNNSVNTLYSSDESVLGSPYIKIEWSLAEIIQPPQPTPTPTDNNMKMSRSDKAVVISNITSSKNNYIAQITSDISSINRLITSEKRTETTVETEYTAYLNTLKSDISTQNNSVNTNLNVILNSKSEIDSLNNDSDYYSRKKQEIDNIEKISNLNIDLLSNYTNSNSTLVKGYPVVIFVVLLILLYLLYVTFNAFMTNIYSVY